jgi:alkanesulfonate monooxygenase SsuD/methylene tetrahydromethanopterin reductase-like flavin-dependent oxidoreductase (luciferase family)
MVLSLLRFDMRLPAFSEVKRPDLYAAALEMAGWADERGFDSLVLSEHHATEDGYLPSPLTLAACLAGRTRRIRIGIAALLLPLYDPIRLAEDLAIVDLASAGRVSVTAGIGYRPEEYAMFGKDWKRRGALMDEGLEVLLRAWTGEPFEYAGRQVQLSPTPLTQPLPPVLVGGMGRNAARRAARFGLPFQPGVGTPEVLELYRSECRRLNVPNPLALPPGAGEMIWVSKDPERSWHQLGPHLLHDARSYASWQQDSHRSVVYTEARSVEELRAEGKYRILTPEQCIEHAGAAQPLAIFVLFPLCGGTPPELAWESLELFANEVLPHVA